MMWDQLNRVSSVGDLGTTTNVLSQSLYLALGSAATATLEALIEEPLPAEALLPSTYDPDRPALLRVLTGNGLLGARGWGRCCEGTHEATRCEGEGGECALPASLAPWCHNARSSHRTHV